MKTIEQLLLLVVVIAITSPALADSVKTVNCDKGGSLTKALKSAGRSLSITLPTTSCGT